MHRAVGEACDKGVHFLLGADIVGFVENGLFFLFGHFGIGVHHRLVRGKRHTKTDGDIIEIHKFSPFQVPSDEGTVSRTG